ncbi:MAG TPA: LysM peptidoglycan-binding domain-containing protein [Planctomycetota bacterium]|nr:LysM peptidoglycan-binding domain-containing protein [Planctomycetota bacterium]
MSDIEKYGLFAVLFVGGILLLVAVSGGFSSDPAPAGATAANSAVVLEKPADLQSPEGQPRGLDTVRVSPLLPTDKPFTFGEPPVAYPGERSTAQPPAPQTAPPAASASQAEPAKAVVLDAPASASSAAATYVIRDGDTLADIAQKQLGKSSRWNELVKLNPGLDPKHLKIGQTIRLSGSSPAVLDKPVAPAPTASAPVAKIDATGSRRHTVVSGDTLGAIAKKYLGSITKADAIYQANRDVLKSADDLKIGQVLRIP